MSADVFVDTNILVYAHDRDAGDKHTRAKALIASRWKQDVWPWVSVQVLQELFVNLTRKGLSLEEAQQAVSDYAQWRVVENTAQLMQAAIAEMPRWQLSFWDSLILTAARAAKATEIWSEDFSPGQDYGGVRVVNPLR